MQLGTLYHAGTEEAVAGLVCDPALIRAHTYTERTGNFIAKYSHDDLFTSKAKMMDISGSVSIKMNLFISSATVTLGMAFMTDRRTSLRQVRTSLKTEVRTESEFLDVFDPDIINNASTSALKLATHVVTGVQWGQRSIGVFESTAKSHVDIKRVRTQLKAEVETMGVKATVFDYNYEYSHDRRSYTSSERVMLHSDYLPDKYPDTRQELMQTIGAAVESLNGTAARGVPVAYTLTPLAIVTPSAEAKLVWEVGADLLEEAQRVVDELEEARVAVKDLFDEDAQGHHAWAAHVSKYMRDFDAWRSQYLLRLDRAITAARMNDRVGPSPVFSDNSVPALLQEYWASDYTAEVVGARARDLRAEIERYLGYVAAVRPKAVRIATSVEHIRESVASTTAQKAYMLLLVDNGPREDVLAVKRFADFAARRLRAGGDPPCIERVDTAGKRFCHENITMIAAHFDSYCSSLCPKAFCPRDAAPNGTRACRTVRRNGTAEGNCTLTDAEAAAEGCWRRPAANESRSAEAGVMGFKALTPGWCSCPSTVVIDMKTGEIAHLPRLPEAPEIVALEDEEEEADPYAQSVVLRVAPPANATVDERVLRYRVTVAYEKSGGTFEEETGKAYYSVAEEFDTADADGAILVTNLQAGRRYFFEVAAINIVGAGPPSLRYPPDAAFQLSSITCAVAVLGIEGGPPGAAVAPEPPLNTLPSWAVAGATAVHVQIATSAQLPYRVAAAAFEDDAGRSFDCENVRSGTLDGAACTIPVAMLMADPAGFGRDKQLTVMVSSASGKALAYGRVTLVAPASATCASFELPDRVLLCEGTIASVNAVAGRHDPLDHSVTVELAVADYDRGVDFSGWRLEAVAEGGTRVRQDRGLGAGGAVRIGGLRAGQVYRFHLSARRLDGTVSRATAGVPAEGFAVRGTLPGAYIVWASGTDAMRNRIPGWSSYGHGVYYVRVILTKPAPAAMAKVVLRSETGSASLSLDVDTSSRSHSMATLQLRAREPFAGWSRKLGLNDGDVPGVFGRQVPYSVLSASGKVLAEGTLVREEISGAACREFESKKPLHCYLPDVSVSKCVSTCSDCSSKASETHQVGDQCISDVCSAADEVICLEARNPASPCVTRSAGCGNCPYDATLTTANGHDVCRPPCIPMTGVSVAAGAQAPLTCPMGTIYNAPPPADPVVFTCPIDNAQRYRNDPGSGTLASWAYGLRAPKCSTCSVADHCNGRAQRVMPNADQTRCECSCLKGYEGSSCEACAAGYVRARGGGCTPSA
eukprot:TRINITY_DN7471_c0_g1_i1.p1 TRINITY_DN7471_c0_g1~~TRINITY_DN7471_c0_g1_i1.p1  ORF type:complete len:1339 (+),score=291.81 TRINITY_DN7471_c0_g1_i1:219-4019(+)